MNKGQYKEITWREQPDFFPEFTDEDKQGGLVQTTCKSDHKILKRRGKNWGKPKSFQRKLSHKIFRRSKVWQED